MHAVRLCMQLLWWVLFCRMQRHAALACFVWCRVCLVAGLVVLVAVSRQYVLSPVSVSAISSCMSVWQLQE